MELLPTFPSSNLWLPRLGSPPLIHSIPKYLSRQSTAAATGAALVVALLAWAYSGDYDANRMRIEAERARGWELDEGFQVADARSAVKRYWIDELLAGRADLVTVAGRFNHADRDCAGCIAVAEMKCPGGCDLSRAPFTRRFAARLG